MINPLSDYQTIRIRKTTLKRLRIIAAKKGVSMVHLLDLWTTQEYDRIEQEEEQERRKRDSQ